MATLDNFLFVGDSFIEGLKEKGLGTYGSNAHFVCKKGVGPKQIMQNLWSKMPDASKVKGVVLLVGVNTWANTTNGSDVDTLIQKLLNKYPKCEVYVQRVFPVNSQYGSN